MRVEFHNAIVTDDVHREKGSVVPDGKIELQAPSYAGQAREGWGDHKLRWIRPLFNRYWEIPIVGSRVTLLEYSSGELRWMPWVPETDIPAWMAGSYPTKSGIQSRSGTLQVVFDETDGFLRLGLATATDKIALWPGLSTWLAEFRTAYLAHTHNGMVPAPTLPVEMVSAVPDCGATKVKGV